MNEVVYKLLYWDDLSFNADNLASDECAVTLAKILMFATGAEHVTPAGFPHPPMINFNSENHYATASTCALILTLPTKYYADYDGFKASLNQSFTMHGGFGLS